MRQEMHKRNERSFITRMNVHFDRYTQHVLFLGRRYHFEMNGGVIRIFPLKYSIISPMSFLNSLADTLQ